MEAFHFHKLSEFSRTRYEFEFLVFIHYGLVPHHRKTSYFLMTILLRQCCLNPPGLIRGLFVRLTSLDSIAQLWWRCVLAWKAILTRTWVSLADICVSPVYTHASSSNTHAKGTLINLCSALHIVCFSCLPLPAPSFKSQPLRKVRFTVSRL